ncbi:MAG: hypothetical protein Q9227_006105 [Pyrenula ochraceoflavens]
MGVVKRMIGQPTSTLSILQSDQLPAEDIKLHGGRKGGRPISATLPRIEGTVEIRPLHGTAPIPISFVTISLQKRETIHSAADSVTKKHLAAPRKEISDTVGKEMLLYRCPAGRESEEISSMDVPFVIFIPFGRGAQETHRRVPPASLQLPSRTAETFYELVVQVQQGNRDQKKFAIPVPISRYDTLSTFGMYSRREVKEAVTDHLVTLQAAINKWSFGPLDPIDVDVRLVPNMDYWNRVRKISISKITIAIVEEVVYNHEGDEPQRKAKQLGKKSETFGIKMPELGFATKMGMVFPAKDQRDQDGVLPRQKQAFPMYNVHSFTTTASLYKIEYYLTVKAQLSNAKDVFLKQPIVVCPWDSAGCKAEMEAIEQSAKDASHVDVSNPMLPSSRIIRAHDADALTCLGVAMVGNVRKPLID